jgi:hypothetical protein
MPVTITRPCAERISSIAVAKDASAHLDARLQGRCRRLRVVLARVSDTHGGQDDGQAGDTQRAAQREGAA